MRPRIYLAGPISGLSYGETVEWRQHVQMMLRHQIDCFSPMRAKKYLQNERAIEDTYSAELGPLSTDRGITARDRWDTCRADLVMVNLLAAQKVSIGTMIELGWADANRVPILTIMEPEGNYHDHAMVREVTSFRVATVEEAIRVARAVLLPGDA